MTRYARDTLAGIALLIAVASPLAQAQTARKPSFYEENKRPASTTDTATASMAPRHAPAFLAQIDTQEDFQQLARTYNAGTLLEIPHLIFVIDRQRQNRVYYINTPRFGLHETFVRRQGLQRHLDKATLNAQYRSPDRRFLFGTISWQRNLPGYTYEFWEGDRLTSELLQLSDATLRATFYAPLRFKTNATQHERVAHAAGLSVVTQEMLIRQQPFLPLNEGRARGRLRIINDVQATTDIAPTDIVVLNEVPLAISPIAGLITQRPSTVLSHINLLAKGWHIPNAYVRDAVTALRDYDGQWVELNVTRSHYQVQRINEPSVSTPTPASTSAPASVHTRLPTPDLSVTTIKPLAALHARDSRYCGVKAANLGALFSALRPAASVPDGFCIPFAQYMAFMRQLHIPERVATLEQRPDFINDASVRRTELQALRQTIINTPADPALVAAWHQQWQNQLQGRGVFVRSSSNSEDLPGFSGAGLYTTVPNVTQPDAFARAILTVWASVYNFEAYEARRAAGMAHDSVVMAILVQQAAASDSAGVMITRDPFDASRRHVTYLSAKRGLGIKVVEGKRQAEQVMYSSWSKAVQVLSRSDEDTQLVANAAGGVREVPIQGTRHVLNDALVARLAAVGKQIKQRLGGVDQDIEWAVHGDQILILQARPYSDGRQ